MRHCMIDLETWGTRPVCAVGTIGAVTFDPIAGKVSDQTFYTTISLKSCMKEKLFVEPDTVSWWMQQSDDARREMTRGETTLFNALEQFNEYWRVNECEFYWCHGATFDEPIHNAACRVANVMIPWKFWNVRDTRTIFDLANITKDQYQTKGTLHHARDDAVSQAHAVCEAYGRLGKWA